MPRDVKTQRSFVSSFLPSFSKARVLPTPKDRSPIRRQHGDRHQLLVFFRVSVRENALRVSSRPPGEIIVEELLRDPRKAQIKLLRNALPTPPPYQSRIGIEMSDDSY